MCARSGSPEPMEDIRPTQDSGSLAGALPEGNEIAIGPAIATSDEENTIGSPISFDDEIVDINSPAEDSDLGGPAEVLSSDSCTESLSNEDDIVSCAESSENDINSPAESLLDENTDSDNGSEPVDPYSKFKNLFDPIYKDASVTLCGAFCAIMEFKRSRHLPFTTIAVYSVHLITHYLRP